MAVKVDENGFLKYEDTTFFREGIFDYAGCEIDPQGKLGLEPKKIYKVYRPKSEVTKKEFVETLNQKPLVDDHTIIGNKPGMMAPERKNCAGVLSDVKVVGNELHGRLDIWSTKMISKIRSGKRELSLAYGCSFIPQKGVFKGERYDFVQSELRAGNHLALVDEARNGHDCRVVDCAFVCDSKFQLEQPDMDWKTISADDLIAGLKDCSDEAKAKAKEFLSTPATDEAKPEEVKPEDAEAPKPEEEEKKEEAKDCDVPARPEDEKPEEKEPVVEKTKDAEPEDKKTAEEEAADAEKKFEEEKAAACDAAVKEYQRAMKLAEDCKPRFGTISMDGVMTEKQLAVKVCALDAAPSFLKSVKPEDAIVALKGYIAGSGISNNQMVGDSVHKTVKKSFADWMKTR